MSNPTIKISDDMPDEDEVHVSKNGKLFFQSDDNNKYFVDFHRQKLIYWFLFTSQAKKI